MPLFNDKIALVTGSGRGIGRAIALKFAQEGADVVVNFFRNRAPAEETADEIRKIGRKALVVKANVAEIDQIDRLVTETVAAFGGVDFLIHNAGNGYNRPILQQKPRGWEWTINTNARSLLFEAQKVAPIMAERGGGAIIALSSLGSNRVMPDYAVVGASKAAIESLVRYLAVELADKSISVNTVSPGVVHTEALEKFAAFREANEGEADVLDQLAKATPVGRLCTPEEVAEVVAFLCSPAATMIRGQTIVMDGGQSLLWQ